MPSIRDARPEDHEEIVALALRAWAPVYASVNEVLGLELATLLHGKDWREHQAGEVRQALMAESTRVWVAESEGALAGFVVAAVVDPRRLIGEIGMVAVDPVTQHRGVGAALIEHATHWLRREGMKVAVISTGGDPGHAPARRLYERVGYQLFPSAQYFKALREQP